MTRTIRNLVIALVVVAGAAASPALADDWHRGGDWREHGFGWRGPEWREHEWREHGGYGYGWAPYAYAAPAYGYYGYAPPPVPYAAPVGSFSLSIPFAMR